MLLTEDSKTTGENALCARPERVLAMVQLAKQIPETLWEDSDFVLSRSTLADDHAPVLLLAPATERPAPGIIARLEQSFALRKELEGCSVAQPLALIFQNGHSVLVLDDPGGDLLTGRIGQPWDTVQFLRVAISLAAALGGLHAQDLIHRDVKPANILVNLATDHVWLIGCCFVSPQPREQVLAPPDEIAGSLAYMSPEQTGRMNRSVDARSDLYSLGITFYEMLTGLLPFDAAEPMEWVHCHIARQPPAVSDLLAEIPASISAIVSKLLSKTAEERYQTAAGLQADLRNCLVEWELHRRIEPFTLGARDIPDRLLIPEKLYGRDRECELLLSAFGRVIVSGRPELMLVSGYSGVGKSSVVNELHKAIVRLRGIFISGKFDQQKPNMPYATLTQACQGFMRQILSKSEAEVTRYRDAIRDALGSNGQLITNLIPDLELIIGKQPPVPEIPPADAHNRFRLVLRRFIGAFARPEQPLALFLDDLQWLDSATLELLEDLLTEQEMHHLLLIGAYRDNEISPSHPLMRTLDTIRKSGSNVQEIALGPLSVEDLTPLVADTLHCEPAAASPLTELIHEKTGGNPFFAIQFFTALADEGLVIFEPTTTAWSWDLTRIRAKGYTDNLADLMVGKLRRLPEPTQEVLGKLACLGNVADVATLALVQEKSEEEVHAALLEAVRAGLVFRLENVYIFLHDRVQEAAYEQIPELQRAAVHLRIGRLFVSRMANEEAGEKIFEIVNQLNRGIGLIETREERERVAGLNLLAGRRAKASTAYASALSYFAAGCALLPEDSWERRYALTFALESALAECEFLTGDFAGAEERLLTLSRRVTDLVERAAVARLRAELYTALDQTKRAVEVALEYLRQRGIDWPLHPTNEEVEGEYRRIWEQLQNRPIEALVDLPPMTDPLQRATLDLLAVTEGPAFFNDENLRSLIVARMVNLSLEYGNSDGSCVAYVQLGWFVGPRFGDHQAAFRFGVLGLELAEYGGLERFKSRVYQIFGYFISPWSRPLHASLELLRRSFGMARETGDIKYAVYACDRLVTLLLAVGRPLGDVQREAENGLEFTGATKFGYVVDTIIGQLRFIRVLRGLSPSFSSFNDADFDENRFEEHLESDPRLRFATCWYWIRKLQARFLAGDYAAALQAAVKAEPLLQRAPGHFEWAEYIFYSSLARAARWNAASPEEQVRYRETLAADYRQLVLWAETCPENFENRAALIGAEVARIEGRELDAQRLYEEAIRSARDNGFAQNDAIANEVAARFYAERGFDTTAHAYIRNARHCYLRWGAVGKVRQLDESHAFLRGELTQLRPATTIAAPVEHLDLAAITKVSQATSGEIVLEKLINTLLRTALEQAGAERGLLILGQGAEQRIEAEARSDRDKVTIDFRQSLITPFELPESMLRYVVRTQESVILTDASTQNIFSDDEYLRQKRPRSVLCLPLVKQRNLLGVLYFENNLAGGVFTPDRLAMLELIASQAAISLEQARLYAELTHANEELQAEIRERRRVEDALRRSDAYLSEAQRLSRTGSFGWDVSSGKMYWSQETFRIFGYDQSTGSTLARILNRTHPGDRLTVQKVFDHVSNERKGFDLEHRLIMPDGSTKYIRVVGRPSTTDESGSFEFVGAVTDITDRKRAEEELRLKEVSLREAQTELAHVSRVTTMGELAASIAHEVNQPLAGIVTNANASLRWLANDSPNLDETREAIRRIIRDGNRAGEIIGRIRDLAKKTPPQKAWLNLNETIGEVTAIARTELQRNRVLLGVQLAGGLPLVLGDRIQLQQVILNLLINAIEAMSGIAESLRDLRVTSETVSDPPGMIRASPLKDKARAEPEPSHVLITVRDSGPGLESPCPDHLFEAFYTTKPHGLGMGLAISRSIIEAHGGRLWATPNTPNGAVFQFALPIRPDGGASSEERVVRSEERGVGS